jgi:hypothetical protein
VAQTALYESKKKGRKKGIPLTTTLIRTRTCGIPQVVERPNSRIGQCCEGALVVFQQITCNNNNNETHERRQFQWLKKTTKAK